MKKIIVTMAVSAMLACGMTVNAQDSHKKGSIDKVERPTPEQMVEHQAARIASELALSDADSQKFITTYKAFKAEQAGIWKNSYRRPMDHEMTDAEVEQKIKSDFQVSRAILDLREKYYQEFRTFMNPKQIQKMYDLEKHNSNSARSELHRRQGGHDFPQKGPQGFQGGHQNFQGQHQGYGQPQGDPKKTQL